MYLEQANNFVEKGYAIFPEFIDTAACEKLISSISTRKTLTNLFLSEKEFKDAPMMRGVNPRPGRNLAEELPMNIVYQSKNFKNLMQQIFGPNFSVMDCKLVMGIPTRNLPEWLLPKIKNNLVNNLGPYVKQEYRDVTYFHGIDYHQDIIDYPEKISNFITAYIYLDKVTSEDAPIHILEKSHKLGCSVFPHNLCKDHNGNAYNYKNDFGLELRCSEKVLLGNPGDFFIWHPATLHGTQPAKSLTPRLSLRLLIECSTELNENSWLQKTNSTIEGPFKLNKTRDDLDKLGAARIKGNKINDS